MIALSTGDPAGIGPEICARFAEQPASAQALFIGDCHWLNTNAQRLGLSVEFVSDTPDGTKLSNHQRCCRHIPLSTQATPGRVDPTNARYVLDTIRLAADLCLASDCEAMVTAPIHKGVINDAGISFQGHTEFLAAHTQTERVVMMLACEKFRVALATTHLPLRHVSDAINPAMLQQTLDILHKDLISKFGISEPEILVCGLNPHAGESGHLGTEDDAIIAPVIKQLNQQGMNLNGPLPADTAFTPRLLKKADAVLAMYHDQGLPVLKYAGFGDAVNITLGLPLVRTSVDHGTALDIAGKGIAESNSLAIAFKAAQSIVASRSELS